jgi:hypothetical protein
LDFIPSKRIPQQDFLDDALVDAGLLWPVKVEIRLHGMMTLCMQYEEDNICMWDDNLVLRRIGQDPRMVPTCVILKVMWRACCEFVVFLLISILSLIQC